MNEDLEQMRQLHRTLTEHQFAALEVIAAADALVDALFATGKGDNPHEAMREYQRVRSDFGRAVLGE